LACLSTAGAAQLYLQKI